MFDTERKKLIATRIKTLRKSKNLSHQTLANELSQKYKIKISKDSLIQYEITDEYHAKWDKVKGMNIEYLYCIADYFKVSTDYLLGNTPNPTQDKNLDAVCKYTELSEKAIEKIIIHKNWYTSPVVSQILESFEFWEFVRLFEIAEIYKEFLQPNGGYIASGILSKLNENNIPDVYRKALILIGESGLISIHKSQINDLFSNLYDKIVLEGENNGNDK